MSRNVGGEWKEWGGLQEIPQPPWNGPTLQADFTACEFHLSLRVISTCINCLCILKKHEIGILREPPNEPYPLFLSTRLTGSEAINIIFSWLRQTKHRCPLSWVYEVYAGDKWIPHSNSFSEIPLFGKFVPLICIQRLITCFPNEPEETSNGNLLWTSWIEPWGRLLIDFIVGSNLCPRKGYSERSGHPLSLGEEFPTVTLRRVMVG